MKTISTLAANNLRTKAEDLLKLKQSKDNKTMTEVEVLKLIHELEVHQIQLEMQNSELELAKELAEVNSQKYTALYDYAPTGYFTLSKKGIIKRLNFYGSQLLGKDRLNVVDRNFEVFVCYDSLPIYNQFLDRVLNSGIKENCELKIRNNGIIIYVYVTAVLSENKDDCLLSIVNITERKSLEIELKESEMRFKVLFDEAPDTMFLADTETKKIVDANNAACRLFKKEKHELLGLSQHELHPQRVIASSKETFDTHFLQSKLQGNSQVIENLILCSDGTEIPVEILAQLIRINDKELMLGTFRDITERKIADKVLLENQLVLNRLLHESSKLIDIKPGAVNYQNLSDTVLEISGAKYVCFNIFDNNGLDFTTVALSGINDNLLKNNSLFGFDILNKKWEHNPLRSERLNKNLIIQYANIHELMIPVFSKSFSKMIEKTFNVKEALIINIIQNNKSIGDFTLIYSKGESIRNTELIALFANQVGLFIERKKAEDSLIKKMDEMSRFNNLVVGREKTMIDLKREVNELLINMGENEKYVIVG